MTNELQYSKFAKYYDKIYENIVDYKKESTFVKWVVNKHKKVREINFLILPAVQETMQFI